MAPRGAALLCLHGCARPCTGFAKLIMLAGLQQAVRLRVSSVDPALAAAAGRCPHLSSPARSTRTVARLCLPPAHADTAHAATKGRMRARALVCALHTVRRLLVCTAGCAWQTPHDCHIPFL
jgi:hypothetical protein